MTKIKGENVPLVAGSVTSGPSVAAFVKQAREIELKSLLIADGLGWTGEWYELAGDASDYVLDQIPQWTTGEAKAFVAEFEGKFDLTPSPSAAGIVWDMANWFIQVCKATLQEYGELNSESLSEYAFDYVLTGKDTYKNGILMKEYKYTPETFPDPVVGEDYYIFPVLQYFGGEGKMVWPDAWQEDELVIPPWVKE